MCCRSVSVFFLLNTSDSVPLVGRCGLYSPIFSYSCISLIGSRGDKVGPPQDAFSTLRLLNYDRKYRLFHLFMRKRYAN